MSHDRVDQARSQALGDVLRRSAGRWPQKLAITDREVRLTYHELDDTVNRVANALTAQGLRRGDRLALLARNCWQYPVIAFATARLGIVLVPVNFMLSAREVSYILDHAGVRAFIWQPGLADVAADALASADVAPDVDVRATTDDVSLWTQRHDATDPGVLVGDDDVIRLMYTSGTESRPKGVMLTSRSLMWQYVSCIIAGEMVVDDVEAHVMPLYHCAQLDSFLIPDLYLGATSHILPSADPATLLATIERERVTKLFAAPTVWIGLLRHPRLHETDLSSLRKGYYGASAMPLAVLGELQDRLPWVRLWNMYGQTEMGPFTTFLPPEEQLSHAGSAGRSALNVETKLVNADGETVGPGEIAEIVHRSPQATPGYYNDPEKTFEAFRDGWFHSGDLGMMDDDGRLTVVDRKKDMIKTGGENVASREVEEVLFQHPDVYEAAVFGVSDPRWIEAVTAVVVLKAGRTATASELIEHCRRSLAGFKTPKHVAIVGSLPRNPSGKVLKRELRERFAGIAGSDGDPSTTVG